MRWTIGLLLALMHCWVASVAGDQPRLAEKVKARGETANRLEQVCGRLNSPPLSDLRFVLSDVTFEKKRRFTEYSGDISGRMVYALDACSRLLDRPMPLLDVLLEEITDYQKADGHFGAEQMLATEISQARDMPILWGNGRLLWALTGRCRHSPSPALLNSARWLGRYVLTTHKYFGREENFTRVGGAYSSGFTTCYPSLIDGLVALGELTGDQRLIDEARYIGKLSLLDREFDKHHSHGRLTSYRGMLDLDRVTATREFLPAVRSGAAFITGQEQLPTGGVPELFGPACDRDEGCSVADWLWVNLLLWRSTGESAYLDAAEHTLRNHLLALQCTNGGFGHRTFRMLSDGQNQVRGGGFTGVGAEAYWCCTMHGAAVLAETVRYGVLSDGEAIAITWLAEVEAELKLGNREVKVLAERVSPADWRVAVRSPVSGPIRLRLRVAGWAEAITVDGDELSGVEGWVEVTRPVYGEAVLSVERPGGVRLVDVHTTQPRKTGLCRVFAGADMYCLPDMEVMPDLLTPNTIPAVALLAGHVPGGDIPVVLVMPDGRRQRTRLVPLCSRPAGASRCVFHTQPVGREAFAEAFGAASPPPVPGKPIELMFACDGDFDLYVNGQQLLSRGGWQESATLAMHVTEPQAVVALVVRSKAARPGLMGVIRAGVRVMATGPEGWSAVPCPAEPPADWLRDETAGLENRVELQDLGGWGAAPWEHIPGEYAGSAARWVWPTATASQPEGAEPARWLVRCRIPLDG